MFFPGPYGCGPGGASPPPARRGSGAFLGSVELGGHENYAPYSLNDLVNKSYDYWALGHVHQAAVLNERPLSYFLGTCRDATYARPVPRVPPLSRWKTAKSWILRPYTLNVVRWAVVPVELENTTSIGETVDRIRAAIENAVATFADGRLLVCCIELQGRTESPLASLRGAD